MSKEIELLIVHHNLLACWTQIDDAWNWREMQMHLKQCNREIKRQPQRNIF